jgi:hypothetical protein
MDPQILLRELIRRLDLEVGHIDERYLHDGGDRPPVGELRVRGIMHLVRALFVAKSALDSGDDEKIASASSICPLLELQGRRMAERHAKAVERLAAAARRQSGGASTGAKNHADAAAFWAPHQARYADLLARGANAAKALATVVKESETAGHPISDRAARKWLRQKKVGTKL